MRADKRFLFMILAGLVMAVLACSAPSVSTVQPTDKATPEQTEEPTPEVVEPTPTEAPVDPTTVCPEPTADTQLYVDEIRGFCLLYPVGFDSSTDPDDPDTNALFVKPIPGDEVVYPPVFSVNVIANLGEAVGVTADDYVDMVIAGAVVSTFTARKEITLAGDLPAVELKVQPAMIPYRALYVAVNDTLYEVKGTPDHDALGAPIPDVELAWMTILESLTFFPPTYSGEVQIPEEICPEPTAETYQYINWLDGYCILVPNSFVEAPESGRGWFIGGPELTGLPEPSRVEAFIGIQDVIGLTVEQVVDDQLRFASDSDSITRTETTVSGYPAVFLEIPQEDFSSRNLLVVVNDHLYTLVVRPVDPVNYPEAVEPAELVWDTFIDSLVFFEPWQ